MYKKNSVPIYRKTQIYSKPLSNTETVDAPPVENVKPPQSTEAVTHKGRPRPKTKTGTQCVDICISHPDMAIGEGSVRVAAWVAARKPYTIANALVNEVTDHNGEVRMLHNCRANEEILIRARATNVYIGPTRDVMYVTPGRNDKIDIKMFPERNYR